MAMRRREADRLAIEQAGPQRMPMIGSRHRHQVPLSELAEAGAEAASLRPHPVWRVPADPGWRMIRDRRDGPSRSFDISR
jgi:hypothetical protein